jgi:phosphoribosylamine--glycine ligase
VLLPRLESDLVDLFEATIDGRLGEAEAHWSARSAVCVVLASHGYPESSDPGQPIAGLEATHDGITMFHAGTRQEADTIVTSGGRVLGVTAVADTLDAARDSAYMAVQQIEFAGRQFRTDIAAKGLRP